MMTRAENALDAEANLKLYLAKREPTARYASFDYCFNYFQAYREHGRLSDLASGEQLQLSCLHLAFYLASWGMLRGSSPLLQRSVKHFAPVVEAIISSEPETWATDADRYDHDSIDLILRVASELRSSLPDPASDILITKIMLGVFGCVPAFDTYFKRGLGVWALGAKSLQQVGAYYTQNRDLIEKYRIPTLEFETGELSHRRYTVAKVIDMIFFIEGARAS
jgi:hypothetical protein